MKIIAIIIGIMLMAEVGLCGVSYEIQDGDVIVTHQFTGDKAKIKKVYNKAAEELYSGTEDFETLTDQEKLDIVHAFIIRQVKDRARRRIVNDAEAVGTTTGNTEYNDTTELNDL